jgi:hypothetical protein
MKIWRLSKDQFKKLTDRFRVNSRFDTEGMRNAKELDKIEGTDKHVKEYLNPTELPLFIDYHTKHGIVRFVRK